MFRSRTLKAATLAAASLGLSFAAMAGDQERQVLQYKLAGDSGVERSIRLDSEELGFDLHDLTEGESRGVTLADGQYVLLTRNGGSLTIEVDGDSFDVPFGMAGMHGSHDLLAAHGDGEHVIKMVHAGADPNELIIFSGEPLDEASREAIRSALEAAGVDRGVRFADGAMDIDIEIDSEDGDAEDTRIVQKRIVRKVVSDD